MNAPVAKALSIPLVDVHRLMGMPGAPCKVVDVSHGTRVDLEGHVEGEPCSRSDEHQHVLLESHEGRTLKVSMGRQGCWRQAVQAYSKHEQLARACCFMLGMGSNGDMIREGNPCPQCVTQSLAEGAITPHIHHKCFRGMLAIDRSRSCTRICQDRAFQALFMRFAGTTSMHRICSVKLVSNSWPRLCRRSCLSILRRSQDMACLMQQRAFCRPSKSSSFLRRPRCRPLHQAA